MVGFDSSFQQRSEAHRQLNTRLAQLNFEGTPLQATYYKVDNLVSTFDPNTGRTKASIGKESPYRYIEVNKFILISNDEMFNGIERTYSEEDSNFIFGQESNMEAEFYIPSQFSLIPQQNDYFTIFFQGMPTKLFRVINVDRSSINEKITAYKIKCSYTSYSLEEDPSLLSINRSVTFRYDNFNSISDFIEEDDEVSTEYKSVKADIFNMVTHKLRDKDGEIPMSFIDGEERILIDPYMCEFLKNNFRYELFMYNLIGAKFKKLYKNSIWAMLEFIVSNGNIPSMHAFPFCDFTARIKKGVENNPYYEPLEIIDVNDNIADPLGETSKPELKPNLINTVDGINALLDDTDLIKSITRQTSKNKGEFYNYTEKDYKIKTDINIEVDVGKVFIDNNVDIIPNITEVINSVLVQKLKKK